MKYIDLNFVKPNKDCEVCDQEYVCFECESIQVKEKYPKAKWDLPDWVIKIGKRASVQAKK